MLSQGQGYYIINESVYFLNGMPIVWTYNNLQGGTVIRGREYSPALMSPDLYLAWIKTDPDINPKAPFGISSRLTRVYGELILRSVSNVSR